MLILKKTYGEAFKKAKKISPEEVIEKIKQSGLTGRGGANFPTGLKWELTRKAKGEKYLICNADEGEPGTFKDKLIIEKNPETLIEGMLIAAYALGSTKAYIYLRKEYSSLRSLLQESIDKVKDLEIKIIIGAGAYICGDETAILNSIEGKRGNPRLKPPYPAEKGLFQKPTCINNVETLTNVALILNDEKWNNDLRLFSISGDVLNGGVFEAPLGISFKDLLDKAKPKEPIKALFMGAAGGCVPYKGDFHFTFEEIKSLGANLGSCSVIVVGKSRSILDACKNIQKFFIHESCGKCLPCRDGNFHLLNALNKKNYEAIDKLIWYIPENSFCGLGQTSTNHLITALKHFRSEF